jgi:hypothetical protein
MDTSDDETTGAAAETRKKTPKAAASAKESSLPKQSELSPRSPFSFRISVLWVGLSDAFCIFSAEFFVDNKNIAGFDNVSCCSLITFIQFRRNS